MRGRLRDKGGAESSSGQVIDVFVSPRRNVRAARRFFEQAIGTTEAAPSEVVSDRAPTYPMVLDELLPAAWHRTDRYANNHIEADHGRLKSGCGRRAASSETAAAKVIITGHALVQNVRRGHYELAVEESTTRRLAVAFDALAEVI